MIVSVRKVLKSGKYPKKAPMTTCPECSFNFDLNAPKGYEGLAQTKCPSCECEFEIHIRNNPTYFSAKKAVENEK